MLSNIGINRIAGVLLIALIPAIILSIFVVNAVDTYDTEFRAVFEEIADGPTQLRIGVGATMVASFLSLALAGALYLTLSPHHKALALFGALGLLFTSVLWIVSGISGIALDRMAGGFNNVFSTAQKASVTSGAQPLGFMVESALFIGLIITLPLASIAFGTLFVRTRVVPSWLGWAGIVSCLIMSSMILSSVAGVFWATGMIGTMLTLLWFAITGGGLLIWGTKKAAHQPPLSTPVPEPQLAS